MKQYIFPLISYNVYYNLRLGDVTYASLWTSVSANYNVIVHRLCTMQSRRFDAGPRIAAQKNEIIYIA